MIDRAIKIARVFSYFQATAYNSKLIPANLVPKTLERPIATGAQRAENLPWIFD